MRRWLPWLRFFPFTHCAREGEVEGWGVEFGLGGIRFTWSFGRENWR